MALLLWALLALPAAAWAATEVSGTISEDTTWSDPVYYATSNVTVSSGVTLTIDPGVVVKFAQGVRLRVDGTLNAEGTADNRIHFTDHRDDTVGDEISEGDPQLGSWRGIEIFSNGNAVMDHVTVRYGGSSAVYARYYANVYKTGDGSLTLTNSVLSHGERYGVHLDDTAGDHTIENNTIAENGSGSSHHGVYLTDATGTVTVTGNTVNDNAGSGIYLSDSNPAITGNTVHDNAGNAGIYLTGAGSTPDIFRNHIHSNAIGISAASSANPLIGGSMANGNDIENNTDHGVYNATTTVEVNAQYNWWGDATGPYHSPENPEGSGNAVSDYVDFSNFLMASALNPAPVIGVSPDEHDFGVVNVDQSSDPVTFTVTNQGTADLPVGTITLGGTDADAFTISADEVSGQTLAPEEGRTLEVQFEPTESGTRTAFLEIPSDDPQLAVQEVALTGLAPGFDDGDGTEEDPYRISEASQLDDVRDFPDKHFRLTGDIDLNDHGGAEGWEPIGVYVEGAWDDPANRPFTGSFDGDGHTVRNLSISRPTMTDIGLGLFGFVDGGEIRDLVLKDVDIEGEGGFSGALVGLLVNGDVRNVRATGRVVETSGIGEDGAGGLVGWATHSATISDSVSGVTVEGTNIAGGLVGALRHSATLTGSYATGDVYGQAAAGGLAGAMDTGASITNAYALGDVDGLQRNGGLIGWLGDEEPGVTNTYAVGAVSGADSSGGLIGEMDASATVTASYYNSETTGQADDVGKGEPRTTAELRAGMAYAPGETYDGWFDEDAPWAIDEGFNGGYPYLTALPRLTVEAELTGDGAVRWTGEYPYGTTAELILEPGSGHSIGDADGCGGTLDGDTFTTGPVMAHCTVAVTFLADTYTVTPSAGSGGSVSPSAPQEVSHGNAKSFTVTPDPGYSHDDAVGGTCPEGSWSNATWTTGAITSDCEVDFSFTRDVPPVVFTDDDDSPLTEPLTSDLGGAVVFRITGGDNPEISELRLNDTAIDHDGALFDLGDDRYELQTHRSGRYEIEVGDDYTTDTLIIDVYPHLTFVSSRQVVRGNNEVTVSVSLNGPAPEYPVTVAYQTTGDVSALPEEVRSGELIITRPGENDSDGRTAKLGFMVGDSTARQEALFQLAEPVNALAGVHMEHALVVEAVQLPPLVDLGLYQQVDGDWEQVAAVVTDRGPVEVRAEVTDFGQEVSYDWSATDHRLDNLSGDDPVFRFHPVLLVPGNYPVELDVSETVLWTSSSAVLMVEVLEQCPDESAADGCGVRDSTGNRIPDHLDATHRGDEPHRARLVVDRPEEAETAASLHLRPGRVARAAGRWGIQVDADDISGFGGPGGTAAAMAQDRGWHNSGGYFDFEITGLTGSGQSALVVLPLDEPIPTGAVYRKYSQVTGWFTFIEDELNRLWSAPRLADGECPPVVSAHYEAGLVPGHECLLLEIEEGGPNDFDRSRNGVVSDPGGVAVPEALEPHSRRGSACFIATAAYGSPIEPQVQVLRELRDTHLMSSATGRWLVGRYYEWSPPLAARVEESATLRLAVRALLTPLVLAISYPSAAALVLVILTGSTLVALRRRTPAGRAQVP